MARSMITEEERQHGQRLGKAVQKARKRTGRTALQVAEATRMSIDTIRGLESGRVPTPGFLTVARVAEAIEVSLDVLHAEARVTASATAERA